MTRTVTISPSSQAMRKRQEARDYAARVLDPVLDPAMQYLRMQKPAPNRVLPTLLSYLKEKADGEELEPDRSKLKLPPMPRDKFPTEFLTPILCELVKEMPPKEEVLASLIAKVELAMGAKAE